MKKAMIVWWCQRQKKRQCGNSKGNGNTNVDGNDAVMAIAVTYLLSHLPLLVLPFPLLLPHCPHCIYHIAIAFVFSIVVTTLPLPLLRLCHSHCLCHYCISVAITITTLPLHSYCNCHGYYHTVPVAFTRPQLRLSLLQHYRCHCNRALPITTIK